MSKQLIKNAKIVSDLTIFEGDLLVENGKISRIDANITVDGMPVNMVSHAHAQGYADLHFIIP
ncbi:MAG: hypothetical protein RIR98_1739, partial [Bacteroidota bacterium]